MTDHTLAPDISLAVRVRLLGQPDWAADQESSPQRLSGERTDQLLAYLAWAGNWVTREQLAQLFWPERSSADARSNVRKLIFRLRARGFPPAMEDAGDAVRWQVETDVAQLLKAIEQQRHDDVARLYGGPFLLGLDGEVSEGFGDWLQNQRQRLASAWRQSLLSLAASSTPARRLVLAETLVAADPLDEVATLALAEAQREVGRPLDADKTVATYERRLKTDLGIEPSSSLRLRIAGWQAPESRPATAARGLPYSLDVFIGRRQELLSLRDLLGRPEVRWVTVVGTGGIGKSRLLQQALATVARELGLETTWVALGEVRHAADVPGCIAAALGIALPRQEQAIGLITAAIGPRPLLLLLDNAEHLDGWTDEVGMLLDACPHLKVAVSSRRRLHARGEWLMPLEGLPQPDADSRDLQAAQSFDAVALFEQRARQVGSNFQLARHLGAVLDIIAAVEGMPLAIELAAAWTRVLTPSQIAAELQRSPELLSEGPDRNGLSMVFERSWAMLSPAERRACIGLSVFSGSSAAMQATAVIGLPLSVFAALADKSMVQTQHDEGPLGGVMRLRLHPLVKHFVQHQADAADLRSFESAHAACFAAWLKQETGKPLSIVDCERIAREWPNLEAALRRAAEQGSATVLQPLTVGITAYAKRTGRLSPGTTLFDDLLKQQQAKPPSSATPAILAPLLAAQADLRLRQGSSELTEELARLGARLARRAGDAGSMHRCLNSLAFALLRLGRLEGALRVAESALPHARKRRDRVATANLLNTLGVALYSRDRLDEAVACFEECLLLDHPDDVPARLNNLNCLVRVHFRRSDWLTSLRICDDAIALAQRVQAPFIEQKTLALNRGYLLFELGDLAGSGEIMNNLLDAVRQEPHPVLEASALLGLSNVLVHQRRHGEAREVIRRALRLSTELKLVEGTVLCARMYGELLADEGEQERAGLLLSYAAHHPAMSDMDSRRATLALQRLDLPAHALDELRRQAVAATSDEMFRQMLVD